MSQDTVREKLIKFLFKYRITPHSTTGIPPAELLMGRRLRSRLDLLQPSLTSKVQQSQMTQKQNHDTKKPYCQFAEGDLVYAENFSTNRDKKWLPGKVIMVTGPLSYVIELSDGNTVRRHVDHIKTRENSHDEVQSPGHDDTNWDYVNTDSSQSKEASMAGPTTDSSTTKSTLRRSTRVCKPPQ